jgi:hypothetical protein
MRVETSDIHFLAVLRPRSHVQVFDRPQVPIIAGQSSGTQESIGLFTQPGCLAGREFTGRLPVAESTVVHVLLIDTFTRSGFYPAVPERSLSSAVSVEY